jgi:hypothetical protein
MSRRGRIPLVRSQITLRLSPDELAKLDAAARRLHLDRAALIRAAALGTADLVLDSAPPLMLAVQPANLLRRLAERVEPRAPKSARPTRKR